jgi:toxin ParE1/3/4
MQNLFALLVQAMRRVVVRLDGEHARQSSHVCDRARAIGGERGMFLTKVVQGLAQADAGETVPHAEAKQAYGGEMRIIWTFQAILDVQATRRDFAPDSPQYAASVTAQLVAAVDRLADFPFSGALVPELLDETVREVFLDTYRVVYRVTPHNLHILTVFHDRVLRFEAAS